MATDVVPTAKPGKALNISLWVAQVLLALAFGMAGGSKVFIPYAQMVAQSPQAAAIPEALMKFIGTSEVLGAIGMILPAATRVLPILTAWAGVGLATIMVLAAALHTSRAEYDHLPPVLILLALAAFVAWGRFKGAPIAKR